MGSPIGQYAKYYSVSVQFSLVTSFSTCLYSSGAW